MDRGEDLDIGIDLLDDAEATGWESLEDLGGRFVTLFAFEECSLRVTLRSFLPRDSEQARVDTSTTFLTAEGMLFSSTEQDAATLDVDFLERSRLGKNSSSDNAPESSSSSDMACNGRSAAAGIGDVAVITSIDTFGINILSSTSSEPLLDSKLAALHSLGVVSFIFLAGLPVFTVAADIKSLGESILSSIWSTILDSRVNTLHARGVVASFWVRRSSTALTVENESCRIFSSGKKLVAPRIEGKSIDVLNRGTSIVFKV